MTQQSIEQLCINTIRTLSLDAVQEANSGHPGLPLGCAPMAYVLWTKFLRFNPNNPKWFNRDRFVLSAGHGSMLLYSLLHLTGYESMPLEEIKNFRQWHSKTPGHPENHITEGVEVTTGPLGQGFANGVGMAMAAKHFAAVFNKDDFKVIDNFVYAICSDGDLMEGVSYEAASLAGHLKLGNLIYLYDDNEITIDGGTSLAFSEDRSKRFEAAGWHVSMVEDGNDLAAIENAIREAQKVTDQPSLIRVRTVIGFGMPNQGTNDAHSDAISDEGARETKRNLGWDEDKKFYVPDEVYEHFREFGEKGAKLEAEWNELVEAYTEKYGAEAKSFELIRNNELPDGWEDALPAFENVESKATREYSGMVINAIAGKIPNLIGGSADLTGSNKTEIKDSKPFQSDSYEGRNLYFGVREHAMGSTMNGMSLYGGTIPYGGTFLTFSDYMRPAIRLAALSELQTIYVFTHDSIGLGEDGPTHQSVEHVTALRAIPHLYVIRPCDAHETREAWRIALKRSNEPTALALSRQKVAVIDREKFADASGTEKGGYILAEASGDEPQIIIIATGSEVGLAMETREKLESEDIPTRVVSMPCRELFYTQPDSYQKEVLPPDVNVRLVIEAGVRLGWEGIIGANGDAITVDKFGASAPAEKVFDEYGFNVENAVSKAKNLI
jgi:transketolase